MTFINTDGMSFIGPGSEWFWTALSGIVLAVTFIAIYRQLRLQANGSAIEQLERFEREYASERMLRARLELLVARRAAADPPRLPPAALEEVASYWERIGTLARLGHLDPKLLWHVHGMGAAVSWQVMQPAVLQQRAIEGNPTRSENLEWLAGVMVELNQRAGISPRALDLDFDARIASLESQIHAAEALRTVVVASPEAAKVATHMPAHG